MERYEERGQERGGSLEWLKFFTEITLSPLSSRFANNRRDRRG